MIETSIERVSGETCRNVYTGERKFINQLLQLQKDYPQDVQLKDYGDGTFGAKVPYDWFRFIKPPTKRNYTEEQRKAMSERMKKVKADKSYEKMYEELSPEAKKLYDDILTGRSLKDENHAN